MLVITREIEPTLRARLASRPCVVLTGCRQTGKTFLARRVLRAGRFVTLDVPSVADEAEHAGGRWLDRYPTPCVIDEVQYAPGLFRHLKHAIDARREEPGQYLLTGSQPFALMERVSESLAGRASLLDLHTLTLGEIEAARGEPAEGEALTRWIFSGGFPEIHAKDLDPAEFHASFLGTYLERDVRSLLAVRSLRDFDRFLRLLALRAGHLLELGALSSEVGVAVNTIKAWLGVLEASAVVSLATPWFENIGKRLVKSPKVYFLDTGLLSGLLSVESPRALDRSAMAGPVFENLVFCEIVKAFANRGLRRPVHFYRDHSGVEVDFVVPEAEKLHLVEVKRNHRGPPPGAFDKVAVAVGPDRIASRTLVTTARGTWEREGVNYRGPGGGGWPWEESPTGRRSPR